MTLPRNLRAFSFSLDIQIGSLIQIEIIFQTYILVNHLYKSAMENSLDRKLRMQCCCIFYDNNIRIIRISYCIRWNFWGWIFVYFVGWSVLV